MIQSLYAEKAYRESLVAKMKLLITIIILLAITGLLVGITINPDEINPTNVIEYLQNLKTTKLIIDTDAGGDDGVALLLALQMFKDNSEVEILAITCVNGNTHVDNVVVNVLKTLRIADQKIPVYRGSNYSILITPESDNYYGEDGFGDVPDPDPPSVGDIDAEHAVLAMTRLVNRYPGEITLIALGPLTNVALAHRLDSTFRENLQALYWLGGSVAGVGNIKPGIEFNAYGDPEANYIVFNGGSNPVIMCSWELVNITTYIPFEWRTDVLGTIESTFIKFINGIERKAFRSHFWAAADAKAMAVVLDGDIVKKANMFRVEAETQGQYSRGGFVVDYKTIGHLKSNVILIEDMDVEKFKNMLIKYLS